MPRCAIMCLVTSTPLSTFQALHSKRRWEILRELLQTIVLKKLLKVCGDVLASWIRDTMWYDLIHLIHLWLIYFGVLFLCLYYNLLERVKRFGSWHRGKRDHVRFAGTRIYLILWETMCEKVSKLLLPLTNSTKIVVCAWLQVPPTPPQPFQSFHIDSPRLPPVVATQFCCGHEDLFEDLAQKTLTATRRPGRLTV